MDKTAFHDINRSKLVSYFEKGDKSTQKLGFELEHILLHVGTGEPVSYSEPGGVRELEESDLCKLFSKPLGKN